MKAIQATTPADGWHLAMSEIANHGWDVITEDGQMTREIQNLIVEIKRPWEGWPIKGAGWTLEALELYANQFFDPDPKGFTYTYGERLHRCDQLRIALDHLKTNPNTRRAIAITWKPCHDPFEQHVPCLQLVEFLNRNGQLDMTCVFRSNDIRDAWPSNVYGLQNLQSEFAVRLGVKQGTLTMHSISAHYYVL